MLNLGYLPGGDKRQTTQTASTITAICDGLTLLAPGGIMTILAYPGHRNGADETTAVERLLKELSPAEFEIHEPSPTTEQNADPRLFVVAERNRVLLNLRIPKVVVLNRLATNGAGFFLPFGPFGKLCNFTAEQWLKILKERPTELVDCRRVDCRVTVSSSLNFRG